ncbi:hypothetical protein J8N08_22765 (plasmid) [Agrobacterium tumefaciens]|uniref:hypothetical protein n=1 Tax=Agrobacterium tumefaciens TaxID=358 RepID=UPI001BB5ABB8|nr:hypothetical protein J8N08_22765 [Agrobacterium tumefaciens]
MEDETFVGDTLPNFSDVFIGYEARIQAIFDTIVAASSVHPPPKLHRGAFIDAFQVQAKRGLGNGGLARNCQPLGHVAGRRPLVCSDVQRPSLRGGSLGFR